MPFGPYKDFEDCIRKVSHRKNPPSDPHAYCGWIKHKIEGQDSQVADYIDNPEALYGFWRLEYLAEAFLSVELMTREKAQEALKHPSEAWKNDPDAVVLDDHRWIHVWAKTLEQGHNLFISKDELKKLHDYIVDELGRRKLDSGLHHQSPIKVSPLELGTSLETLLKNRQGFCFEPEGIVFVGSDVSGKADPRDQDVMWKNNRNPKWGNRLLESLPDNLRQGIEQIWDPGGPNGPYIPGYEFWAIPIKELKVLEPTYHIYPMSPFPPATPKFEIADPREILEDSYFIAPIGGLRLMVHRKERQVIAFDEDLDEASLPEEVSEAILDIDEPRTFILDGYLTRKQGKPVFCMLDLPWWRQSEHIRQTTEERRGFLSRIKTSSALQLASMQYFPNRRDAIDYLKEEKGPLLLIPGSCGYSIDGAADWYLYRKDDALKLAEGADDKIRELVDSERWESIEASERFSLMTKREKVEPLYPYAQLKTTKKGYSEREVFGLKSVDALAKELFKVPTKQAIEVKIDGFRVQGHKKGDQIKLFTESGHEITKQLPSITADFKKVTAKDLILDCECTPYDEDFRNLGRAGAAPAFAKGAKKPVDDSRWALHVFDVLYINGEDIHNLPYEERRTRLHGLELPVRDAPDNGADFKYHLWENHVYWATSAEAMIKFAGQVAKVAGSEGAMFKQSDSKYRLSGSTPLWSKMKTQYEIDALVVGINQEGSRYNYVGAVGPISGVEADVEAPVDTPKGRKFVKWKGKIYSILGKTFNTSLKADLGAILRVTVKDVRKIDSNVYHWFHPQVLEVREDKTKPDPIQTAETISKTASQTKLSLSTLVCVICGKPASYYAAGGVFCEEHIKSVQKGKYQRKHAAYMVSARYGSSSPLACCKGSWLAVPGEEDFIYLQNNGDAYAKLKELGVLTIYGTAIQREALETLRDLELEFVQVDAEEIETVHEICELSEEPHLLDSMEINLTEFNEFYDGIRSSPIPGLKLQCGAIVPLKRELHLEDAYQVYPEGPQRFVLQGHVRGLSVHFDPRIVISKSQAIGWTWNLGKSLIKPMLRRTPRELRTKAGITELDLKLPIRELSEKLQDSPEGKSLMKALTKKTQEVKFSEIKTMLEELWKDEVEPILADPNQKILTQKKIPTTPEWLDYEEEVPPGAVGATSELEGQLVIMDEGTAEFGTQKSYFHEYFIKGKRIGSRKFVVRRIATRKEWRTKESFAWLTFFTKPGERPYVISRRAVQQGWMPPKNVSALPGYVERQIPDHLKFWKSGKPKETRDELVDALKKRNVVLKLKEKLQYAVKRVWHKGPEVKRGLPVTRYWLIIHNGQRVLDAFDFGLDSDPLEEEGLTARRGDLKGLGRLLSTTGELPASHPVSWTKKIKTSFDTSDTGTANILEDQNSVLRVHFEGRVLKGEYVFVKESENIWIMQKVRLSEIKKAMFFTNLESDVCTIKNYGRILRLSVDEIEVVKQDDRLLLIRGPAIKPGEVLPSDGRPSYFTKEGISKFWPSMYRQPVVVLHGDLKGDVIGFVGKNWFDEKTGWGWVEAVIWHPIGIQLILEKKLAAFSIEVMPQSIWDPEHQHDHVIGGSCVGLAVVPKGACPTCVPIDAQQATIKIVPGKVYKFGMTAEQFAQDRYWRLGMTTTEIAQRMDVPRSTLEGWMAQANIPRRSLQEAWNLRRRNEEMLKLGGRTVITALGTGAFTELEGDDPQIREAEAGGKSRRNFTATMFSIGSQHLLINAPKGIGQMLGSRGLKPQHVLLEHMHEDVVGGLHELRPFKPIVFATKDVWDYLRRHYRAVSKEKGEFEDIYPFERRVMPPGKVFRINAFRVKSVIVNHASKDQPEALGFLINMGKLVWHCSDIYDIPGRKAVLKGVDLYIGDGASLKRDIGNQHASMEKQVSWTQEAEIPKVYFTQIGRVHITHDKLNEALHEMTPNAQALYDGAEMSLGGSNPVAMLSEKVASGLLSGETRILIRDKPHSEYAKQAILFAGGEGVLGLYVEGFPEGPFPADKVRVERRKDHGLSDVEWRRALGDAAQVWIYTPRILKQYEQPKLISNVEEAQIYIHDARLTR